MNINNSFFWSRYFKDIFEPQISSILSLLEDRLLPSFGSIEAESDEASKAEWERLHTLSGPEDADMGALAEQAYEAGIAHFSMTTGLQQGLQNMFAVALLHLFEQQMFIFHRREVLHPSEDRDTKLICQREFQKRLMGYGIIIESFRSWALLKELRLVANTVKHAEGDSAFILFQIRPDLFSPSNSVFENTPWPKASARVFSPIMGEDIYISTEQLKTYAAAVIEFWKEMSAALAPS